MASGRSDEFPVSSDEEEEEMFAGFTVEEIGQIQQDHQRWRSQELLCEKDGEMEAFLAREPQETDNNSDVEVFADSDGGVEDSSEISDKETADECEEVPPNPIRWSNTAQEITVEECSVPHSPTRDLGNDASAKDFFILFIGDAHLLFTPTPRETKPLSPIEQKFQYQSYYPPGTTSRKWWNTCFGFSSICLQSTLSTWRRYPARRIRISLIFDGNLPSFLLPATMATKGLQTQANLPLTPSQARKICGDTF